MTEHNHDHDGDHEMIAPRLKDAVSAGCAESRLLLSRRAMLGVSAGLFSWACLPRHAEAFDGDRRLLLVVMRGGLDGLHVSYQASEMEMLRSYRGAMFDSHSRGADYLAGYQKLGESGFRLNSQLTNLGSWFNTGNAALVHAVAPPLRSRSHFDCSDNLENGQADQSNPTRDGWLNRFLAGLSANEPASRALGDGSTPLILMGNAPVQSWSGGRLNSLGDAFSGNLIQTYAQSGNPLFHTIGSKLASGVQTNRLATAQPASGITAPPASALVHSFRGTARLMKQEAGPRVAVLSVGGLDTHSGQIMLLDAKLKDFDTALGAFRTELGEAIWNRTVVVCVTEFGRTVRINSSGTDHGTGTLAFLAGGNVNGGRVHTDWPGLGSLQDNRDLKATTDTRALFKGLLRDHLGLRDEKFMNTRVFPGSHAITPLAGLVKIPAATRLILRT
jgi:uncharacterized protein (DUF1501 family)